MFTARFCAAKMSQHPKRDYTITREYFNAKF